MTCHSPYHNSGDKVTLQLTKLDTVSRQNGSRSRGSLTLYVMKMSMMKKEVKTRSP